MATTPRRSDRGILFSPAPSAPSTTPATRGKAAPTIATSYHWLTAPYYPAGPSSSGAADAVPHYTAYKRLVDRTTLVKRRKHAKVGFEESRFAVGDGVLVNVQGGNDGVGILVRLWEEEEEEDSDSDESGSGGDSDEDVGNGQGVKQAKKARNTTMMGEIHWCFRRSDLPSMMRDLSVAENEVLLAASPIRRVSTSLPISLLVRTVPIYSRSFFRKQFAPRGRASLPASIRQVRQGVYWCDRAFDKGAKGGKVWRIDVDGWRTKGKAGEGWGVPMVPWEGDSSEEEGSDDDYENGKEEEGSEEEDEGDSGDDVEGDEDQEMDGEGKVKKRKSKARSSTATKKPRLATATTITAAARKKRKAHPSAPATFIPSSIPALESLPSDPYERALRLLHVGATPESLPCREEEFVDVLGKVEEGVESGGGGCLYIAGVPGTGKTATVHAVVKELKRKAEDGELPPFSYVEINGLKIPSPQHAYTVLWEAISGSAGVSAKTALRGLEAHFGRKTGGARGPRGHTFVVLMDELDQLLTAKQDVVYNFFNWPTMRDSQMFVIAVANRMDLPQHLAAKIKSRLGLQTLLFQPYDRQNLIDIVQSRLVAHPHSKEDHKVLLPDAIALAATKMAGTNGDARRVLDACRRAVEVTMEKSQPSPAAGDSTSTSAGAPTSALQIRKPVSAKEMMAVLNQMSSSPVAMFIRSCSEQQKMMLAAVVRCVRREGVPEIAWRSVRSDHDNLTRSLLESNDLLSPSELLLVFTSLIASHALTAAVDAKIGQDERRVALGMEIGEVGRVLMGEGESWRRALAGT